MTTTFYAPPDQFHGERLVLPDQEARHAIKVLRKRAGEEIIVVDGVGGWHRVRLDQVGQHRAAGTVLATRRQVGEPSYQLTIALGLIKNRSRFETFVEKAVELGVHAIVPLQTTRTEKQGLKRERTRNIMVAAMKQCGRSRLPTLDPVTALPALMEGAGDYDATLIAHEQTDAAQTVAGALAEVPAAARLLVVVGSEGGLTSEEVATGTRAGGQVVSLGPRRLRAETAGIAAAVAVQQQLSRAGSPHSL